MHELRKPSFYKKRPLTFGLSIFLLPLLSACFTPIEDPLYLADGTEVSAEVLERGRIAYTLYCRACHGDNGDGLGPAAGGLRPPPRDLRQGKFKFAAVASGELPNDDDLKRIIKGGLKGTAMLPWDDIPEEDLEGIIQYIKIFTPPGEDYSIWEDQEPGTPIRPTRDPFAAQTEEELAALEQWKTTPGFQPQTPAAKLAIERETKAIEQGKKIYHALAQCVSCHPAYATKKDIYDLSEGSVTEFRENYLSSDLKDSDYKFPLPPLKDDSAVELHGEEDEEELEGEEDPEEELEEEEPEERWATLFIMPTDFLLDPVRSGTTYPDLYRTIASGIGGTAMPSWRGSLPEEDIWAMVHYVAYLIDIKNNPKSGKLKALQDELSNQAPFTPPAAPPPPASIPASEPSSAPASDTTTAPTQ